MQVKQESNIQDFIRTTIGDTLTTETASLLIMAMTEHFNLQLNIKPYTFQHYSRRKKRFCWLPQILQNTG